MHVPPWIFKHFRNQDHIVAPFLPFSPNCETEIKPVLKTYNSGEMPPARCQNPKHVVVA